MDIVDLVMLQLNIRKEKMRISKMGFASSIMCGLLVLSTAGITAAGATEMVQSGEAKYTLDKFETLTSRATSQSPKTRSAALQGKAVQDIYVTAALPGEAPAVLDTGLASKGDSLIAATSKYVDLSWKSTRNRTYTIVKDGKVIGATEGSSFRDSQVTQGSTVEYQIYTETSSNGTLAKDEATVRGFEVKVPKANADLAAEAATLNARAAVNYSMASLRYRTFIPQAKIDAPSVGAPGISCSYKSGYQFGGDNRGFKSEGGTSRTDQTANIRFNGAGLIGSSKSMGATTVYKKSTGKQVAKKTASTKDMSIKQLGKDSAGVDLRVSVKAGNPFCTGNSIQGAFTITINKNATYRIVSGSHRLMPNHEVYLTSVTGGWKKAYQRKYLHATCLVAWACPEGSMTGYYGSY